MRCSVLIVLAASACIESSLVPCSDGRVCPVGTLCDDPHITCVTADQLQACTGADDGTPCTAGSLSGVCWEDVTETGCGPTHRC